jgi:signal transduction histidine kinase
VQDWIARRSLTVSTCAAAILAIAAMALAIILSPQGAPQPQAQSGGLDLRGWNFSGHGAVTLAGPWRADAQGSHHSLSFMLTLPHEPGVGPASRDPWALETGSLPRHYRLYIADELVLDTRALSAGGGEGLAHTPLSVRAFSAQAPVVIRYVVEGPLLSGPAFLTQPRVGLWSDLGVRRQFLQAVSWTLIGAMLFACGYHLVTYFTTKEGAISLSFSAFAFLLGVRSFFIEPLAEYTVQVSGPEALWRLNFAFTILLGPACYAFFRASYPAYVPRGFGVALNGLCAILTAICLIGPPDAATFALKIFQVSALAIVTIVLQAVLRSAVNREPGSTLALAGWFASAFATVHDILADNGLISGINLLPFGFIAFFLCLSGSLALRFQRAFTATERLSGELRALNETLEARIAERTLELSDKVEELERNRSELERARENAVSASKAKSQFLANMSHELRTPLNAILGFSEIIKDRVFGDSAPDRYSEYAGAIHSSGTRLLGLINGILDFSKLQAGRYEIRDTVCCLAEECAAAIARALPKARLKSVELAAESGGAPMMSADPRALAQILDNLLDNAIQHSPEGGRVLVQARRSGAGEGEVTIADQGPGIPDEALSGVMESFGQRPHDKTTRALRGPGLGLPIARGLAEAHGGRLTLCRAEGQGLLATVTLPRERVRTCDAGMAAG